MTDLNYGSVVCDLHDGWDLSRLGDSVTIVDKVVMETNFGSGFIANTLSALLGEPYQYTNKHLVAVGEWAEGLVLAATYDNIFYLVNVRCEV